MKRLRNRFIRKNICLSDEDYESETIHTDAKSVIHSLNEKSDSPLVYNSQARNSAIEFPTVTEQTNITKKQRQSSPFNTILDNSPSHSNNVPPATIIDHNDSNLFSSDEDCGLPRISSPVLPEEHPSSPKNVKQNKLKKKKNSVKRKNRITISEEELNPWSELFAVADPPINPVELRGKTRGVSRLLRNQDQDNNSLLNDVSNNDQDEDTASDSEQSIKGSESEEEEEEEEERPDIWRHLIIEVVTKTNINSMKTKNQSHHTIDPIKQESIDHDKKCHTINHLVLSDTTNVNPQTCGSSYDSNQLQNLNEDTDQLTCVLSDSSLVKKDSYSSNHQNSDIFEEDTQLLNEESNQLKEDDFIGDINDLDVEQALAAMNYTHQLVYIKEQEQKLKRLAESRRNRKEAMQGMNAQRAKQILLTSLRYLCPQQPLWTNKDDLELDHTIGSIGINVGNSNSTNTKQFIIPNVAFPLAIQRDPLRSFRTATPEIQQKAAMELQARLALTTESAYKWCVLEGLVCSLQEPVTDRDRLLSSVNAQWLGLDESRQIDTLWLNKDKMNEKLSDSFPVLYQQLDTIITPSISDIQEVNTLISRFPKFQRWVDKKKMNRQLQNRHRTNNPLSKKNYFNETTQLSEQTRMRKQQTNKTNSTELLLSVQKDHQSSNCTEQSKNKSTSIHSLKANDTSIEHILPMGVSPKKQTVSSKILLSNVLPLTNSSSSSIVFKKHEHVDHLEESRHDIDTPIDHVIVNNGTTNHQQSIDYQTIYEGDKQMNDPNRLVDQENSTYQQTDVSLHSLSPKIDEDSSDIQEEMSLIKETSRIPEESSLIRPTKVITSETMLEMKMNENLNTFNTENLSQDCSISSMQQHHMYNDQTLLAPNHNKLEDASNDPIILSTNNRSVNFHEQLKLSCYKANRSDLLQKRPKNQRGEEAKRYLDQVADEGESEPESSDDTDQQQQKLRTMKSHEDKVDDEADDDDDDDDVIDDLIAIDDEEDQTIWSSDVLQLHKSQKEADADNIYKRLFTMDGVRQVRAERQADPTLLQDITITRRQLQRKMEAEKEDEALLNEELELEMLVEKTLLKKRQKKTRQLRNENWNSDNSFTDSSDNASDDDLKLTINDENKSLYQFGKKSITHAFSPRRLSNKKASPSFNTLLTPIIPLIDETILHHPLKQSKKSSQVCHKHPAFQFQSGHPLNSMHHVNESEQSNVSKNGKNATESNHVEFPISYPWKCSKDDVSPNTSLSSERSKFTQSDISSMAQLLRINRYKQDSSNGNHQTCSTHAKPIGFMEKLRETNSNL